jgi:lipopolysaccharide/colanic/teichoic acid biosynthesis glycosyltransferase
MLETYESTQSGAVFRHWNHSAGKRCFDVVCASFLLLLSSPVLLLVALLVKCSSRGPVLYSHQRVGKDGALFGVLKFRTMFADRQIVGPSLTRRGDRRVTAVGRVLREWKLDELPQFINVVRGEMSLVGPRPDAPEYVHELTSEQKLVLGLSPGITGAASLEYRDEEAMLSDITTEEQLGKFYCTELLPAKVRLDMNYARRANFLTDLVILIRTLGVILR